MQNRRCLCAYICHNPSIKEAKDSTESVHLLREDREYYDRVLKREKKRLHQAIISPRSENEFPIYLLRKSRLQIIDHSYFIPFTSTWFSFNLFFFPPVSEKVFFPLLFLRLVSTYLYIIFFTHYFLFIHFFVHNPQKSPLERFPPSILKSPSLNKMWWWYRALKQASNVPGSYKLGSLETCLWTISSVKSSDWALTISVLMFLVFLIHQQGNTWSVLQRTMNKMDNSCFHFL